ncbi:MAG: hypothetical protein QGG33_05855, partial [Candidatus Krumholzibacteria bacterium]|nr:hypothetical protein [Candidatus Krumholzibacteria bacterium]
AWLPWKGWDEEEDSVTQLSGKGALISGLTPFGPGESGEYLFLVQAKDEAGAVTSHFEDGTNMKKIKASSVLSPTLYVFEPTLGFKMSEEWSVYDFTIAEDQPLNFQWFASAESYGSKITGYRYGWDIIDTDNDDEWTNWSLPDDPATSNSFSSSTHWLYIQCKDYSGNISTILLRFLVIPFTMEKELLFIDDYDNTFLSVGFNPDEYEPGEYYPPTWTSNFVKTDDGMKSFWEDMLSDYANWNPYSDFFRVNVLTTRPPFELIANYKHIVWESASSQTASGLYWITRFVDPRAASDVPFDYVSAFMKRGGQVMICGTLPLYATIPKSGDVDDNLNPNRNWTPLSYMRNFHFQTGSVEESVKRYLPYQQFGIDVLIKTIEPLPRPPLNVAVKPYKTVPTYWGMVAAEPTRLEEESFSLNYPLPDSLLMSEDVHLWFDYAAGVFDHDGFFGLSDVEAYNWEWYAQYLEPPIFYRESKYIRFLNYVPADSTTRYGHAPVAVHPHEEENQSETVNMDELAYSIPHVTDEGDTLYGSAAGPEHGLAIGLIGLDNPGAPNVILGFHPLYLDRDHAKQLIDHILVDIFDIEK